MIHSKHTHASQTTQKGNQTSSNNRFTLTCSFLNWFKHTHKQPPPPPNRNNIYNTFWETSSPKTLRQLNVFNASHLYPTDPTCHARGPAFEPVTFCICASSFSPSTSWSSWLPVEVSMRKFLERERTQEIKTSINVWNTISNSSFVPYFFSKR